MIAQITSFQTRLSLIGDFLIWPSLSGISPKLHPIHLENYNSPRSTEPVLDAKYCNSCAMHMGYEAICGARVRSSCSGTQRGGGTAGIFFCCGFFNDDDAARRGTEYMTYKL